MTTGTTTWITAKCDMGKLEKKLRKLQYGISPCAIEASVEAMEHIHQKAMENLNSNLIWGHGVQWGAEETSIENSKVIETWSEGNRIKGSLSYTSPHAKLMEYGGFYIYNRDPELGPMPIGRQQGHTPPDYYSYSIEGNIQGKFFLTQAFMSEVSAVHSIYEKYMNNLIKSTG